MNKLNDYNGLRRQQLIDHKLKNPRTCAEPDCDYDMTLAMASKLRCNACQAVRKKKQEAARGVRRNIEAKRLRHKKNALRKCRRCKTSIADRGCRAIHCVSCQEERVKEYIAKLQTVQDKITAARRCWVCDTPIGHLHPRHQWCKPCYEKRRIEIDKYNDGRRSTCPTLELKTEKGEWRYGPAARKKARLRAFEKSC